MSEPLLPTFVTIAVTLLGALIAAVWRFATLAASLSSMMATLQMDSKELRSKLEALERMPLIEQRLGQLEKLQSIVPKLSAEVAGLAIKIESYRDAEVWRRSGGDFK